MKSYRHIPIIVITLVLLAVLSACSDETTSVNFRDPANRYLQSSTTESAVIKQLRQQFYEETGSYLIFNDTLQHRFMGTDLNGDPQWFTETVDLTYTVGTEASGVTKYRYTLLQTDAEKQGAVEFLRIYVLPHFTGKIRPYAWMLTETITHNDNFGTYNDYAASGQEVAAVACKLIPTLNDANKERYTAQVINILLGKLILNNSSAFEAFFAVCEDLYTMQFADTEITNDENNKLLWNAGFITRGKDPQSSGVSNGFYPDKENDLTSFCRTIIANSKEKLEATYGDYPLVMQKLQLARETMEAIGYIF